MSCVETVETVEKTKVTLIETYRHHLRCRFLPALAVMKIRKFSQPD